MSEPNIVVQARAYVEGQLDPVENVKGIDITLDDKFVEFPLDELQSLIETGNFDDAFLIVRIR